MRAVTWPMRALAVLLCVSIGALDHQAFRSIPALEGVYYSDVGHALLLLIAGFVAGLLLRTWWSLLIVPLAYTAGFEAAITVVSGTAGQLPEMQHILWLLVTASAPAVPLMVGAALATAGDQWRRRRWRRRLDPTPPDTQDSPNPPSPHNGVLRALTIGRRQKDAHLIPGLGRPVAVGIPACWNTSTRSRQSELCYEEAAMSTPSVSTRTEPGDPRDSDARTPVMLASDLDDALHATLYDLLVDEGYHVCAPRDPTEGLALLRAGDCGAIVIVPLPPASVTTQRGWLAALAAAQSSEPIIALRLRKRCALIGLASGLTNHESGSVAAPSIWNALMTRWRAALAAPFDVDALMDALMVASQRLQCAA